MAEEVTGEFLRLLKWAFDLTTPKTLPNEVDELPYFLVAFLLTKYLMGSYPGHIIDDIGKAVFNYRLSNTRRNIENSFGMEDVSSS